MFLFSDHADHDADHDADHQCVYILLKNNNLQVMPTMPTIKRVRACAFFIKSIL